MDKVYGYTLCYSKLAIGVSLCIHLAGALLSAVAIFSTTNLDDQFISVMRKYHNQLSSKSMVDNIQWALQCCGSNNYRDWFLFDWTGSQLRRRR